MSMLSRDVFIFFILFAFINPSLNPVIYASRYEVFKRFLKQKMNKITPSNATQSTGTQHKTGTVTQR